MRAANSARMPTHTLDSPPAVISRNTPPILKYALAPSRSAAVSIAITADSIQSYAAGVIKGCSSSGTVNHAVTIVGYTDAMPLASGGTWKVRGAGLLFGGGGVYASPPPSRPLALASLPQHRPPDPAAAPF